MILNKNEIELRIKSDPSMVSNIKDLKLQLQPAALDLTVKNIFSFMTAGYLDFNNSNRLLSLVNKCYFDELGFSLGRGVYQIEVNETFNMPLDVVGTTVSRSSLQRCGCAILQGYFDPGFIGKGVVLLNVLNSHGLYLYENARVCQMVFHSINPTEGYNGKYQEMK
jgi:deoxycytidine triphosphate deaminase